MNNTLAELAQKEIHLKKSISKTGKLFTFYYEKPAINILGYQYYVTEMWKHDYIWRQIVYTLI